jgi:hypothetical protein
MFPEVFAYPASKQEMQLSSFFDTTGRGSAKAAPKCGAPPPQQQYAFGAAPVAAALGSGGGGAGAMTPAVSSCCDIENDRSHADAAAAAALQRQAMLHAVRRVVKITVTPAISAGALCVCVSLNTLVCVVVPEGVAPVMATLWGTFSHLWLLVTMLQLMTHSVYLYTTPGHVLGALHLATVVSTAVLLPSSLFARWLWLAPSLCVVVVAYQAYVFCLVYAQYIHQPWMYASIAGALTLLPMTQLAQIITVDDDTRLSCCLWSALSLCMIYAFALVNCRGSSPVDVTIGTNPTRPQHE